MKEKKRSVTRVKVKTLCEEKEKRKKINVPCQNKDLFPLSLSLMSLMPLGKDHQANCVHTREGERFFPFGELRGYLNYCLYQWRGGGGKMLHQIEDETKSKETRAREHSRALN